jgi:hypothetical protein
MKTNKIITVLISALFVLTIISCSNNDESTNRDYLDNITGTYTGEFNSENTLAKTTGTAGTADITLTNNNQLQIHCYGETMDTTIIMYAFQNGDSVMICNSGEDFYNEYGHMENGYHMMDMGMNQTDWMHHMQDEHQDGDEHYGGFNMQNHSFHYAFKMMENDTVYMNEFNGMKQ